MDAAARKDCFGKPSSWKLTKKDAEAAISRHAADCTELLAMPCMPDTRLPVRPNARVINKGSKKKKVISGRPASKATARKTTTSRVPQAARVTAEAAAAVAAETETARLVAVTEAEATPAEQARLAAEAAAAAAEAVPTPQKRRQRRPAKKPELMMVSSAEHYEKAPTFECLLRWMTDDPERLVEHFADRCPRSTQTLPKRSARSMVRVS